MFRLGKLSVFTAFGPLIFALAGLAGMGCIPVEIAWDGSDSVTTLPTSTPAPLGGGGGGTVGPVASAVLGQLDFNTLKSVRRGLYSPKGVASDGTRLVIADSGNHRVLIWNTIPANSFIPPDIVVGQATFNTTSSGLSATQLNTPTGVALGGGKLFVADRFNNRVLIWNTIPTVNGAPADVVVGQATMNTASSAASQSGLSQPADVATDGTRLIVADTSHHRILIWIVIPNANGANSDYVIGQSIFTAGSANHGASVDLLGLNGPESVSTARDAARGG
jgi:hypothetical protein